MVQTISFRLANAAAAILLALAVGAVGAVTAGTARAQAHAPAEDGEGPLFVVVEPLLVTVFDRGAARGRVTIELLLDVIERDQAANVRARLPRVVDAFLTTLTQYTTTRAAITGPPDLELLMPQFQAQADAPFGDGVVHVLVNLALRTL